MDQKKLTKLQQQLLIALEKSNNNVHLACKSARVARETYYRNYRTHALFAEKVDEIKYKIDDILEQTALSVAINEKNPQLLIFLLKTRLKDRGYQEKIQTEEVGKKGNTIVYNIKDLSDEQLSKILKEEEEPKDDF